MPSVRFHFGEGGGLLSLTLRVIADRVHAGADGLPEEPAPATCVQGQRSKRHERRSLSGNEWLSPALEVVAIHPSHRRHQVASMAWFSRFVVSAPIQLTCTRTIAQWHRDPHTLTSSASSFRQWPFICFTAGWGRPRLYPWRSSCSLCRSSFSSSSTCGRHKAHHVARRPYGF